MIEFLSYYFNICDTVNVNVQSSCDFFSADWFIDFESVCFLPLTSECTFDGLYYSVLYHLVSSSLLLIS